MKKLILLLLASAVATTAAAQAQRDTLTFNNDYYFSKRNVEELVPVTGQNIVMLGNSLTERGFWAEYLQGKRVLNRGIGGDCISGMINRGQRCQRPAFLEDFERETPAAVRTPA